MERETTKLQRLNKSGNKLIGVVLCVLSMVLASAFGQSMIHITKTEGLGETS